MINGRVVCYMDDDALRDFLGFLRVDHLIDIPIDAIPNLPLEARIDFAEAHKRRKKKSPSKI